MSENYKRYSYHNVLCIKNHIIVPNNTYLCLKRSYHEGIYLNKEDHRMTNIKAMTFLNIYFLTSLQSFLQATYYSPKEIMVLIISKCFSKVQQNISLLVVNSFEFRLCGLVY